MFQTYNQKSVILFFQKGVTKCTSTQTVDEFSIGAEIEAQWNADNWYTAKILSTTERSKSFITLFLIAIYISHQVKITFSETFHFLGNLLR